MIFKKLQVDVPSLNSVLNFKIDGVEELLQPQKVCAQDCTLPNGLVPMFSYFTMAGAHACRLYPDTFCARIWRMFHFDPNHILSLL